MTLVEIREAIGSRSDEEQMELMMELCPRLMRRVSESPDLREKMYERCRTMRSDPDMRSMMAVMRGCMGADALEGD